MLGKTAGGLFWMFRYLERSENTARLADAGFRIALTRTAGSDEDWGSILETAGVADDYDQHYSKVDRARVLDFLLADRKNPSSVLSSMHAARSNARLVRTALTREVWEATNESWITLSDTLSRPIEEQELPEILATVRRQSALVRGALHGTMLRNDAYDFAQLGMSVERADNTARILDVKYYVLLPSAFKVGSSYDNAQWETVLRSVSGQRAFRWLNAHEVSARSIADFLIFDQRMPRSLAFSSAQTARCLKYLEEAYELETECRRTAGKRVKALAANNVDNVLGEGLHEFLAAFRSDNAALAGQIESEFRFNG